MDAVQHFLDFVVRFKLIQRDSQICVHRILQCLDDRVFELGYWAQLYLTGSFYEGMPSEVCSDRDQMVCEAYYPIVQPLGSSPLGDKKVLIAEDSKEQAVFLKLRLNDNRFSQTDDLISKMTKGSFPYARSDIFVQVTGEQDSEINGPAKTEHHMIGDPKFGLKDCVQCLYCPSWPTKATGFLHRERKSGWPTQGLVKRIEKAGCHVVAVGYKLSRDKHLEWRWSFSLAEQTLFHVMDESMAGSVYSMKLLKHDMIPSGDSSTIADKGICSYFIKTACLWVFEQIEVRSTGNIITLVVHVLDWLIGSYTSGCLPHYFIPEQNLLSHLSGSATADVTARLQSAREGMHSKLLSSLPMHSTLLRFINGMCSGLKLDVSDCDYESKCNRIYSKLTNRQSQDLLSFLETKSTEEVRKIVSDIHCGGIIYEEERKIWASYWSTLTLTLLYMPLVRRLFQSDLMMMLKLPNMIFDIARISIHKKLDLCPAFQTLYNTSFDRYMGDAFMMFACMAQQDVSTELTEFIDACYANVEMYYTRGLYIIHPGGFDDQGFSGYVKFALFYHLTDQKQECNQALQHVSNMMQRETIDLMSQKNYLSDLAIRRDLDLCLLPWRCDPVLYRHLVERCPDAWVYVNPVSLAFYIRIAYVIRHGQRHVAEGIVTKMESVPNESWYFIEHKHSHERLTDAVTEILL